jgi:hypothetical protein
MGHGAWGDEEMGRWGDGWGDRVNPQNDEFLSFSVMPPISSLSLSFHPPLSPSPII